MSVTPSRLCSYLHQYPFERALMRHPDSSVPARDPRADRPAEPELATLVV